MSKKICPVTGSDGCMESECLFYQRTYTNDYMCEFKAALVHLNEIANNLRLLVKSNEQHREMVTQSYKSAIERRATPELLRLVGVDNER